MLRMVKEVIMELRILHYFSVVATEKNITHAANILHVSQPTLSRQLKDLENQIGVTLFRRGNRQIYLTEEGLYLQQQTEKILSLVDHTHQNLQTQKEVQGEISLGAGESPSTSIIAQVIKVIHAEYPQIKFRLSSGDGDDIMRDMDNGILDFGLVIDPFDKHKYNFIQLPVTDTWGILCHKDMPLAKEKTVTPQTLFKQPLIVSRQSLNNGLISEWLGTSLNNIDVVSSYSLLYNASQLVEKKLVMHCALKGSSRLT